MTIESATPTASEGQPNGTIARARADRGRTVIEDRVRRRLVEHAVRTVPGTSEHRGLTGLVGLGLPTVQFSDHERSIDVHVAASWPVDSARLVAEVRSSIDGELARSLGEEPATTHVHIARIDNSERSPDAPFSHLSENEPGALESPAVSSRRGPRRIAGAVFVAVPLILLLLTVGIIAIRDTIVSFGWAHGDRWLDSVFRIADDICWQWWTWPAVIAALLVGLIFIVTALTPRRRSHTAVSDELWLGRHLHSLRRKEIEAP